MTCSRRHCLSSLATMGMLGTALGPIKSAWSQDDVSLDNLYVRDRLDEACDLAVSFLLKAQRPEGSISDRGHAIALTSLAIMALASVGVEPGEPGERGRAMRAALDFVLQDGNQMESGYYGDRDGSRMYGHGIITLMLTEMLGMGATEEQNRLIHERLEAALRLLLSSQSVSKPSKFQGGWRYAPGSTDSDLSVTIWQLMALRSAKNDGMKVPAEAIESSLGYLRESFTGRRFDDGTKAGTVSEGGFSYTPGQSRPTFAMTAAGLLAMQVCGQYEAPEVAAAADWLLAHRPKSKERYLYYGLYYYAQGITNTVASMPRNPIESCRRCYCRRSGETGRGLHPVPKNETWASSTPHRLRSCLYLFAFTTCRFINDDTSLHG